MSRVISRVTGKPYGLAAVCRVWRLARSGVYRPRSTPPARQRRGPLGAMTDDALTMEIRDALAASPLQLMRQNNLLAPSRVGSPRGPRNHDGTIIPDTVDVMWGTI